MDDLTLIFLVFISFILINYFINSNNSEDFCQCYYYNNNKDNFCQCAYKKTKNLNIENYKIDHYTLNSENFQNVDNYTVEQSSENFQNAVPFQSSIRDDTNNNYFNYIFGNPKI